MICTRAIQEIFVALVGLLQLNCSLVQDERSPRISAMQPFSNSRNVNGKRSEFLSPEAEPCWKLF